MKTLNFARKLLFKNRQLLHWYVVSSSNPSLWIPNANIRFGIQLHTENSATRTLPKGFETPIIQEQYL